MRSERLSLFDALFMRRRQTTARDASRPMMPRRFSPRSMPSREPACFVSPDRISGESTTHGRRGGLTHKALRGLQAMGPRFGQNLDLGVYLPFRRRSKRGRQIRAQRPGLLGVIYRDRAPLERKCDSIGCYVRRGAMEPRPVSRGAPGKQGRDCFHGRSWA